MTKRLIIGSRQRINTNDISTQQAAESLIPYIEAGIKHFDTADHYADGEEILGILNQQYGDKITIGTKRCPDPIPIQDGEVRTAVELSLSKLQSQSIDIMQFHDWMPHDNYGIERLRQLAALQQEGLIKKIGLTNANVAYLKRLIDIGICVSSNQICHSLFAYRPDSEMMKYSRDHDIEVLAFGTVGGGFFSEKRLYQSEPSYNDLSNASLKKYKRFLDIVCGRELFQELLQCLAIIAQKHSVSIATIASSFILHQPGINAVIIGARLGQSSYIDENKKILSIVLDTEDKNKIQNILNYYHRLPGDYGDEYRLDHSHLRGGHEFLTSTGKGGYKGHQINFII